MNDITHTHNQVQLEQLRELSKAPVSINDSLLALLKTRYESAKRTQIRNGIQFDLTFEEFLTLVGAGKRQTIMKHMKQETTEKFFRSYSGYCLTWKDKASLKAKIMNVDTAVYINRRMSKRVNQLEKGETHSEESKQKISKSKTGSTHKEKTKKKISEALTGREMSDETKAKMAAAKKGKTKSPEERARIAQSMRAALAAKKAAKEAKGND